MQTYRPGSVPEDPKDIPNYLKREVASIRKAAFAGNDYLALRPLATGPDIPQDGLYNLTAANPNASGGAGIYWYDTASATWTQL